MYLYLFLKKKSGIYDLIKYLYIFILFMYLYMQLFHLEKSHRSVKPATSSAMAAAKVTLDEARLLLSNFGSNQGRVM